jgi:hypothetical protein
MRTHRSGRRLVSCRMSSGTGLKIEVPGTREECLTRLLVVGVNRNDRPSERGKPVVPVAPLLAESHMNQILLERKRFCESGPFCLWILSTVHGVVFANRKSDATVGPLPRLLRQSSQPATPLWYANARPSSQSVSHHKICAVRPLDRHRLIEAADEDGCNHDRGGNDDPIEHGDVPSACRSPVLRQVMP